MEPRQTLEFRVESSIRRIAWYFAVGALGCVILLPLSFALVPGLEMDAERIGAAAALAVMFGGPAVYGLLFAHRYRIRVDQRGVWRRRILGWDLWAWEAFEQGRTEKAGLSFYDPSKPVWKRALSFALEPRAIAMVFRLCDQAWVPPAVSPLEGALAITIGWRKRIQLSDEGLLVEYRGRRRSYQWDQVLELRLILCEARSTSFGRADLTLPDQKVTIHARAVTRWSSSEVRKVLRQVTALLRDHIGLDRTSIVTGGMTPLNVQDAQWRLDELQERSEKEQRDARRWGPVGGTILLALAVMASIDGGWRIALLFGVILGVVVPLFWAMYKHKNRLMARRRAVLEAWIAGERRDEDDPYLTGLITPGLT